MNEWRNEGRKKWHRKRNSCSGGLKQVTSRSQKLPQYWFCTSGQRRILLFCLKVNGKGMKYLGIMTVRGIILWQYWHNIFSFLGIRTLEIVLWDITDRASSAFWVLGRLLALLCDVIPDTVFPAFWLLGRLEALFCNITDTVFPTFWVLGQKELEKNNGCKISSKSLQIYNVGLLGI